MAKKKVTKKLDENYDIAYDFATKTYKKFRDVIKAIVLFGSVTKGEAKHKSDIDLVIIIDDCTVNWDDELISWYREELAKLLASQKYKKDVHINTVTLTAFWKELQEGDPVAINVLRSGQPLIDHGGFFSPLKILLRRGKIRPTPEAIFISLQRAPMHLNRSKFAILNAVEGLYWAMVDSAHSALMAAGHTPPSPEHIYDMLEKVFGSNLNKKFRSYFKEMYSVAHSITHGNVKSLHGKQIDDLRDKAEDFVEEMSKHVKRLT